MKKQTRRAVSILRFVLPLFLSSFLLYAAGPKGEFHVSPEGSPQGNGSIAAPWDLGTALSHPPGVRPNDTIWVHGGTYQGGFVSRLQGGPEAPIVVRQYPGGRVVLNNGASSSAILEVEGAWTWFWGLEFTDSEETGSAQYQAAPMPSAVVVRGGYIKFINLVLHTGSAGFDVTASAYGIEIYGNRIYGRAGRAAEGGRDGSSPKDLFALPTLKVQLLDNVVVYGEPPVPMPLGGSPEALVESTHFEENLIYPQYSAIHAAPAALRTLLLGQGHNAAGKLIPAPKLDLARPRSVVTLSPAGAFAQQGPVQIVSEVRGIRSLIRLNRYEERRAHVIVHDPGDRVVLAIDLSEVLREGDRYEIRDVEDFLGSPAVSGRYDGLPILIPAPRGPANALGTNTGADQNRLGRLRTFVLLPIPLPAAGSTNSVIHGGARPDASESVPLAPPLSFSPGLTSTFPAPVNIDSTGQIIVYRLGENNSRQTAPRGGARLDSSTESAQNPRLYDSVAAGSHAVSASNVIGLVESVGTCTYPVGDSECVVADFPISPVCGDTACVTPVSVSAGHVTKVVFKYVGVYEGFGSTIGGRNGTIIRVTNLSGDGPGSLDAALADACVNGNRYIVFDVGGEIVANNNLRVCGVNVTVDGLTAPTPVTLRRTGLTVRVVDLEAVDRGAHDIVIRGLRIRKDNSAGSDGTQDKAVLIEAGGSSYTGSNRAHHIVFANNSVSGSPDDMIVIGRESHNITFTGNIISHAGIFGLGFMILDYSHSISIYNNLLAHSADRNPFITWNNQPPGLGDAPNLTADFRNNLIGLTQAFDGAAASTSAGTSVGRGAKANVVSNYYVGLPNLRNNSRAIDNALIICNPGSNWVNPRTSNGYCGETVQPLSFTRAGGAYVRGNVVVSAYNPSPAVPTDDWTTTTSPFPAAPITTSTAFSAACRALSEVGARPSDAQDSQLLEEVRAEVEKLGVCGVFSSPRARSATRRLSGAQ